MLGNLLKGVLGPIVDGFLKFIPDKNKREEAKEQLEGQMLTAMTSLVEGQLAINAKEAEHGSIFVAGWRPWIGWTCGVAIGWSFVAQPLLTWVLAVTLLVTNPELELPPLPMLDVGPLMTLVLGMLGLGGLRTYEKRLGVARTKTD
jgi:hypothetical protein